MYANETFDESGACVERLTVDGLFVDSGNGLELVRPATAAEVAAALAAGTAPPPTLDVRVATVEASVATLDSIIVAVLS
jgi:hypothetical protein